MITPRARVTETGSASLELVANGIASPSALVNIK